MGSTLTFSAGAWLWPALAVGVVALAALAWGYHRAAGHPWRWGLAALKALGCAALVLCLLEPTWVRQRARPGANLFAVLADNSQSLQVRDPGATRARGEELREWSQIITATLEPTTGVEDLEKGQIAISKMRPYLEEVISHRRKNMGDDMLSSLISVEEQGEKLNNEELMSFVILLYIAGHETTVNLIGNSMHALLTHPEQLAVMREAGCTPNMVDELLRFNGPVQHTIRTPLVDSVIRVGQDDIKISKGSLVLASLGASNHDPSVFTNPHELDFSRKNSNKHLAFAAGVHYCLGASLAKLETEVVLGTLVKNFKNIEVVSQPEWRDRLTIRGVSKYELSVS